MPRDLETIILKAMAKRAEDRYQTAAELADDLRRWLRLEPIRARRIGPVGRTIRWSRRNPALATLSAVLVLITVFGFAEVTWHWKQAEQARKQAEEAYQRARQAQEEAQDNLAQ